MAVWRSTRAVVDAKSERSCGAIVGVGRTGRPPLPMTRWSAPPPPGFIGQVDLTTPESGGGDRPLLTWEPVDNAVHYDVVLRDADVPRGGPPRVNCPSVDRSDHRSARSSRASWTASRWMLPEL